MTRISDRSAIDLRGWPRGVDNLSRDVSVSSDALRIARNVDLDTVGKPTRRAGYTQVLSGNFASPYVFGPWLIAWVDGVLIALDNDFVATPLVAGVRENVTYALAPDGLYWSDGLQIGRIESGLVASPVWVDAPRGAWRAEVTATGGFAPGEYQVAVSAVDARGRESGTGPAVGVSLAAGQGIRLLGLDSPPSATFFRFYVTHPNGSILHRLSDQPTGMPVYLLSEGTRGEVLATQWGYPMPAAEHLAVVNGRVFALHGRVLRWSEPLRYGMTVHDNYLTLRTSGTMLLGIPNAGLFVADSDKVYFITSTDPAAMRVNIVRHAAAVPGTGRVLPAELFAGLFEGVELGDFVAYWLGSDGAFCLGTSAGAVLVLADRTVRAFADAAHGATLVRDATDGQKVLTTLYGGRASGLLAQDSAEATVIKQGT